MKSIFIICLVSCVLMTTGCNDLLAGIGIGVVSNEAFDSWEESLEQKRIELDVLYEKELKKLETASDPNELNFVKQRLEELRIAKAANLGARIFVDEIRDKESDAPTTEKLIQYALSMAFVVFGGNEYRKRRGLERGVNRLEIETDPEMARHIDETIRNSLRILNRKTS